MHSYYKAIGFSKLKTRFELDLLTKDIVNNPTTKIISSISHDTKLVQLFKEYSMDSLHSVGISVVGELDKFNEFHLEHSFPYAIPSVTMTQNEITFEKKKDIEAFSGICEDINLGVSLIFHLQNIADYVKTTWSNSHISNLNTVSLSALSLSGKVLLEISKSKRQKQNEEAIRQNRNNLIAAARSGDINAIESLTLDDMDTYTIISKRSKSEDVLSIVDTYVIPYGIDYEQYSVLGIIQSVDTITNSYTGETLYSLLVECNNISMQIVIHSDDLLGEPKPGRRFKGIIWLQGIVSM